MANLKGFKMLITPVAIMCAVAIAACGSVGKLSSAATTSGGQSASLVSFAVCMRSHGVSSFPDSSAGPGGGVSVVPAGINQSAPAFKTAFSICSRLLPALGRHQQPTAQATAQMLKFSQCMRAHGVTGFPDPTETPPADFGDYSSVVRRGGVYLAVPSTINAASPAYKHAAAACRFGPVFS
jgi:hypothetical protein